MLIAIELCHAIKLIGTIHVPCHAIKFSGKEKSIFHLTGLATGLLQPMNTAIYEQPEGWEHLQQWFDRTDDPLRPWNVSAISRHVQLPQAVVRALLKGPKGSDGMSRTAFTVARLRMFQRMFRRYHYRVSIQEKIESDNCRAQLLPPGPLLTPYAYSGNLSLAKP